MCNFIFETIRSNLDFVVPLFLPGIFVAISYLFKAFLGDKSLLTCGSDISFSGCSLYIINILGLAIGPVTISKVDLVTSFIVGLFFIFIWFICLLLSYKKAPKIFFFDFQPAFSIGIGVLHFYFCCVFSWQLLFMKGISSNGS